MSLQDLAHLVGIEDGWWDFYGAWRDVPDSTRLAFLRAMGIAAETDGQIAESLARLQQKSWRRWLEPVVVWDQSWQDPAIAISLPASLDQAPFTWELREETGITHQGRFQPDQLQWVEEIWLDGALFKRWRLHLAGLPGLGYHSFRLTGPDGMAEQVIAVAPVQAFSPPGMNDLTRCWGLAAQIYALRQPGDWGVGTYKALEKLAGGAARLGAACVGVNPLHALFPGQSAKYSPYAPSSRLFLNITYIDVQAIPEFKDCTEAKRMFASPGFLANVARINAYPLIEYDDVARLQTPALDALYRYFVDRADPARQQSFADFKGRGGAGLQRFTLFEALNEHFCKQSIGWWPDWPAPYQNPDSAEVARFAADNAARLDYFAWTQFIADEQLAQAHKAGRDNGSAIGLYRDLGVGIAGDGADSWIYQGQLALGISVGAPPDPLALKGQDWGLLPFDPIRLKDAAFAPFIAMLRANMRHAGALRLDHAMSLARLYWVPPGLDADQGAYVRYPMEDLFRLVALESHRAQCLVIGEDLGTVPDGFREMMDRTNIFAYRVMVFEQNADGFKAPDSYDQRALAIAATHDLPSLRGWWNEADIRQRAKLKLFPRPGMADEQRAHRAKERADLVAMLAGQGLLPADFPTTTGLDDAKAQALTHAAHLFLAKCRSRLLMIQPEDVLALDLQMNLPGTTIQHPNWRYRLPVGVDDFLADPKLVDLANQINTLT